MTLEEIKAHKRVLAEQIQDAMAEFSKNTGLVPQIQISTKTFNVEEEERPIYHSAVIDISIDL